MNAADEIPSAPVDAIVALGASVVLLDVREDGEWSAGHAPRAIHIPLGELPERQGELDRCRRIVCICRSGNRSAEATAWLRAQQFDAVNMTGGLKAWSAGGHPLVDRQGRPGVVV